MRYVILILSLLISGFFMLLAVQNAWISATPVDNPSIFQEKAMFYFPISIAFVLVGVGAFIFITMRNRRK